MVFDFNVQDKIEFFREKTAKGAYSAIVYKEGDSVIAEDNKGRKIAEGVAGTDDAKVIQTALNLAKRVFISSGEYIVNDLLLKSNTIIEGEGENTILKSNTNAPVIKTQVGSGILTMFSIVRDLKIDGNLKNAHPVYLVGIQQCLFEKVRVVNAGGGHACWYISGNEGYQQGSHHNTFIHCQANKGGWGFKLTGVTGSGRSNQNTFISPRVSDCDVAFEITTGIKNTIINPYFSSGAVNNAVLFKIVEGYRNHVISPYFEQNPGSSGVTAIYFDSQASNNLIENPNFDLTDTNIVNLGSGNRVLSHDRRLDYEVEITIVKGAGSNITGNASTTYTLLDGLQIFWRPDNWNENIIKAVYFQVYWNPQTTAGGLKLYNVTQGTDVAVIEPGTTGWRYDYVDITNTIKGYAGQGTQTLHIQTKGDGATAPTIAMASLKVVVSEGYTG